VIIGAWDASLIAAKTATYGATLGAAGACLLLQYLKRLLAEHERRKIGRLVAGLSLLAILAGASQIVLSAASMANEAAGAFDASLLSLVWQAGAGHATVIRAIGLALAALCARSDRGSWLAVFGAALAATSFAWSGHARALGPGATAMILQGVHLLAAAFWLGALAPLLILTRTAEASRLAAAAARFGRLALVVVGALLAAGLSLLWLLLGHLDALWSSDYGRCVLAKLVLVAVLLSVAAFNKLRLTPRLGAGDMAAVAQLRISIVAELVLAGLILTVTATLTSVTGPPALD
jgi:putative copper resistance protein D